MLETEASTTFRWVVYTHRKKSKVHRIELKNIVDGVLPLKHDRAWVNPRFATASEIVEEKERLEEFARHQVKLNSLAQLEYRERESYKEHSLRYIAGITCLQDGPEKQFIESPTGKLLYLSTDHDYKDRDRFVAEINKLAIPNNDTSIRLNDIIDSITVTMRVAIEEYGTESEQLPGLDLALTFLSADLLPIQKEYRQLRETVIIAKENARLVEPRRGRRGRWS